jgi:hypothetical protein
MAPQETWRSGVPLRGLQTLGTSSVAPGTINPPRELEKIGPLYALLMEEIKRRTEVVQQVLGGHSFFPPMANFELCYVELRKICEVFALACLAAHGDIAGVRSKLMQKSYNADQIIKQLDRLHPTFYPIPSEQTLDPVSQRPISVSAIKTDFLTKEDLFALYGECGNYLHRGTIRQLLTKWEPSLDFERISRWIGKIIRLLNHHQIRTSEPNTQLWVLMHGKDDGKVHWHIMKAVSPQPPPPNAQPSK